MRSRRFLAVLLFACGVAAVPGAAEFDVDTGATLLRRLQLCVDCGSALLVTRVHPGVMIRCPDCGREQGRLRDTFLITQVYQLCRLCQAPLDAHGRKPGEAVDCPNCHTRQVLTPDAFLPPGQEGGPGYPPDFPPGSGPKRLLYETGAANELAAAGAGVAPDPFPALPHPVAPASALPLDSPAAPPPAAPFLPEPAPPRPPPPPQLPPETAALAGPATSTESIEVPAVSVEMFGGRRQTAKPAPTVVAGGGVLARVNGAPIRAETLEAIAAPALAALKANPLRLDANSLAARERELRESVLNRLVDREIAAEEAERLGYKPDPAQLREKTAQLAPRLAGTPLEPAREAARELAFEAVRRQFAERAEDISPEAVRAFYQKHKDEMLQPRKIAVASLTVFRDRSGKSDQRDYRAIAQDIAAQLERGVRFDEIRAGRDEFPPPAAETTPPLLPETYFAEEIRELVAEFRTGAVFGPVFLPGLVLFGKINEIVPAQPLPFAEVEKDIRRRLIAEEAEKQFTRWLDAARKSAAVEIY